MKEKNQKSSIPSALLRPGHGPPLARRRRFLRLGELLLDRPRRREDPIDHAIFECLLGAEVLVAVEVALDLGHGLAGGVAEDGVDVVADAEELWREGRRFFFFFGVFFFVVVVEVVRLSFRGIFFLSLSLSLFLSRGFSSSLSRELLPFPSSSRLKSTTKR